MSYKVVKNSAGDVIAFGPNCEEFSPSVNDGEFLSVVEELPVTQQPNPRIAEIKAELIALDIKRIRPLAESDADYLATLNAQAIALRGELTSLTSQEGVAKTASDASTEKASADSSGASANTADASNQGG